MIEGRGDVSAIFEVAAGFSRVVMQCDNILWRHILMCPLSPCFLGGFI